MLTIVRIFFILNIFFLNQGYGQLLYQNEVFTFIIPDQFDQLDQSIIDDMNLTEGKKGWNRYMIGFVDKESNVLLFQLIEMKKTISNLEEFEELMFSKKILNILENRGQRLIEKRRFNSKNALYNQVYDKNNGMHTGNITILNKVGFLIVKYIEYTSNEEIDFETIKEISEMVYINDQYIGFPSYNFFHDLNWTQILLKGFIGGMSSAIPKVKIPNKN